MPKKGEDREKEEQRTNEKSRAQEQSDAVAATKRAKESSYCLWAEHVNEKVERVSESLSKMHKKEVKRMSQEKERR